MHPWPRMRRDGTRAPNRQPTQPPDRRIHPPSLLGRDLLEERIEEILRLQGRHGGNLLVLAMGLSETAAPPIRAGADGADRLPIAIARRLKANLRATDVVGYLGTLSFAVFIPYVPGETQALALGQRLVDRVCFSFDAGDGQIVPVSVCTGLAFSGHCGTAPQAALLLAEGETALDRARGVGPGQWHLYGAHDHTIDIAAQNDLIRRRTG